MKTLARFIGHVFFMAMFALQLIVSLQTVQASIVPPQYLLSLMVAGMCVIVFLWITTMKGLRK